MVSTLYMGGDRYSRASEGRPLVSIAVTRIETFILVHSRHSNNKTKRKTKEEPNFDWVKFGEADMSLFSNKMGKKCF
jgi:hypothetical protein